MALSLLQLDADPQRSNSVPPIPTRPKFNSMLTSDRLRISSGTGTLSTGKSIRKGRKSIFKELGLDDFGAGDSALAIPTSVIPVASRTVGGTGSCDDRLFGEITGLVSGLENNSGGTYKTAGSASASHSMRDEKEASPSTHDYSHPRSTISTIASTEQETENDGSRPRQQTLESSQPWYARLPISRRPKVKTAASAPPATISSLHRFTMVALLIAVVLPGLLLQRGSRGKAADAGPVPDTIVPRGKSPVDTCKRWAQQVALLNGTFYIYGGQTKDEPDQGTDTWNNRFLTLDLTKSWDISKPALSGLDQPDGPPKVSLGYLWNDYNNLYLYGGEFADNPYVDPSRESIWRYSVRDKSWTEFQDPKTSDGKFAEDGGQPVRRAAEGAGLSVPELGLSWYFGGHLDWATTPGWSRQVGRVYLKSLLEFTHPGYANSMVNGLHNSGAPDEGAIRNITQGGLQAEDKVAFPERADGALVFVPGWGESGVLLGLAGGTNDTFTMDLSTLDVYDIATSEWYHQETSGEAPGVRVNLCAVTASAEDASSFQVYVFGGQNLIPFGEQIQYNDMYILSIPSFTWYKVDQGGQDHVPSPRAGHTCTMRDGQMVVVGGYVGKDIDCDSPGMYVFDASSLKWQDKFEAADHAPDYESGNSVKAGSYGYQVPDPVVKVIGGDGGGGATLSTPVAGATGGPFATGKPPVYTVTRSGHTATITSGPGATGGLDSGDGDRPNPGLIAAGVLAGLFGLLAAYLGFCMYLYRRQVSAYKKHLAVANRYSARSESGLMVVPGRGRHRDTSVSTDNSFGWVGTAVEPRWLSDEPTPGSNSGSGGGSGPGGKRRSDDRRGDYASVTLEERPGTRSSAGQGSVSSTERLLEGQEPSFFSVVMGPRRALRVVNGID